MKVTENGSDDPIICMPISMVSPYTLGETTQKGLLYMELGAENLLLLKKLLLQAVHLAPTEGQNKTLYKDVTFFRTTDPTPPMPALYQSSFILILQGRKRVFLGDKIFQYDPQHYLLVTSQMPMLCEVEAEPNKPVLGISINLDLSLLSELVMEMSAIAQEYKPAPLSKGACTGEVTPQIVQTLYRLVDCLSDLTRTQLFARSILRELYFFLLTGPNGQTMQRLARDPRYERLNRVVHHINQNFASPIRVDDLADMASMSIATFHQNFKALTSSSPLQYLKNIRLTKARHLILHDGMNVRQAATAVGYESPSQFSREFHRLFDEPPTYTKRQQN